MTRGFAADLLHYLRTLTGGTVLRDQTDRELLARFAAGRDEEAFTALVRRHGPLVWGVCRRLLGHTPDAEDAFQAVFLILARKASSVRWQKEVGNWLHAVAYRVTRKARAAAARRRSRERQVESMPEVEMPAAQSRELDPILDEEVSRLPHRYRAPVVLCYLQGKTYVEAAQMLGWPEGTVSGRLARARDLLHARLTRRGLSLSVGALTLLFAESAGQAAPAALLPITVRAALGFVTGAAAPTAASVLAKGALRTMFTSGLKKVVAVLLVLAGLGTGAWAFWGTTTPPQQVAEKPAERGKPAPVAAPAPAPLPAAWKGRWLANPFAGAEVLGVEHVRRGPGGNRTYVIKDPKVIAALVGTDPVIGIQNGIAVGLSPNAWLTVRHKDGSTFRTMIGSDDYLYPNNATLRMRRGFIAELERRLSAQEGSPIDLGTALPAVAGANRPPRGVPASARSLTAGFKSLTIQYFAAKRLREVRITDAKTLDEIHRALTIRKQGPVGNEKPSSSTFTVVSKDGSTFRGQLLSPTAFFSYGVGRFDVGPAFVKALDKYANELAGHEVRLLGDNEPTKEQVRRGKQASRLLHENIKAIRFPRLPGGKELNITIDNPKNLVAILKQLKWMEVPVRKPKLERGTVLAELETASGKKIRLTRLDTGKDYDKVAVGPVMADLVEVSGFGPVWIDNQWKYALSNYAYRLQLEAEERKTEATTRLVMSDWPAFLGQVISATVHYRQGKDQLGACLTRADSRPILVALSRGKVEKLDWKRERWLQEMKPLEGAGMIELAPGLGFSLSLIVRSEKEMLVPYYGKITFTDSPLPVVQQAVEDDPAKVATVELLPK
jgi:RNA polymerase sigma factor (sigma-70 family)